MRSWRRYLLIVAFLAPVVVIAGGLSWAILRNNRDMDAWRGDFYEATDLDGTELIERGARFGLQPGTNGDHCDREAWAVYETDLDAATERMHFSTALDPTDGELTVTTEERGTIRVDWWYRFNDTGWDLRCT